MSLKDEPSLRAFLFADPAGHSLSPQMHRAAFAHAGLPGQYDAVRVAPGELRGALEGLRRAGVLGANLSLPHKETAVPLLDTVSDAARMIGAVNTVIHRDGQLHGDNTDAPGLIAALDECGFHAGSLAGARHAVPRDVIILGAGGAARAAVYALAPAGSRVWIVNRTLGRAQALAEAAGLPGGQVHAAPAGAVAWEEAALVVNASSAGLNDPDQTPLDAAHLARLPQGALVYDMVYRPAETRLMREARAAGLRAENGLGMLAHQARLAFLAWTGVNVPVTTFQEALVQEARVQEGLTAGDAFRPA